MRKGKIIFLNGVSSSGKTTLAKILQEKLPTPFYLHSCDQYVNMWPEKYLEENAVESFLKLQSAMHRTIKLFSDSGIDCIVDHVLLSPWRSLDDCVLALHTSPVLFVQVVCSLEELRRREKERGDREEGQAESQLPYLSPKSTYDITVDTSVNSVHECADKIIEMLKHPGSWQAFSYIREQQSSAKTLDSL